MLLFPNYLEQALKKKKKKSLVHPSIHLFIYTDTLNKYLMNAMELGLEYGVCLALGKKVVNRAERHDGFSPCEIPMPAWGQALSWGQRK